MDGFWQFANEHWIIALIIIYLGYEIALAPFKLLSRWIRHRNIAVAGWPKNPLMDADGDIVHPESSDE